MKYIVRVCLFSFLMMTLSVSLQAQNKKGVKSKTTSTATSGKLTSAGANEIIIYLNSIGDFFQTSFKLSHIIEYGQNIKTAYNERGQKIRTNVYDPYLQADKLDEAIESYKSRIAGWKSQGVYKVDPTSPPAVIGSANVNEMTGYWNSLNSAYQECLGAREEIRKYVDSDLELRDSENEENLKNAVENYEQKANTFYDIVEKIYAKMDELGDMAEDVTLAKHPMKNEITDMRKAMRAGAAIYKIIAKYDDSKAIEPKLGQIAELNTVLKGFLEKYASYDYESGKNFQIKSMKGSIKSFYEIVERMNKETDLLPTKIESDFHSVEVNAKQCAEYLDLYYSEFISRNNSR